MDTTAAEQWHQTAADRIYERIESREDFDVEAALMNAHLNIPGNDHADR